MAGELIHTEVGTVLNEAEFDSTTGHSLNSQATGDLIYASSATQLTRLAIGATDTVLRVAAGIPSWSATLAGLTLTAPTINGTVATTGLTLPAFTGGIITFNGQYCLVRDVNTSGLTLAGGSGASPWNNSGLVETYGGAHATTPGAVQIYTCNAAQNGAVSRLVITGVTATAVATWASVTHTGLKITSAGNIDCAGTGANGWTIKNPKNSAATALSGTQLDITIDIGGTPYYFTCYPTKA